MPDSTDLVLSFLVGASISEARRRWSYSGRSWDTEPSEKVNWYGEVSDVLDDGALVVGELRDRLFGKFSEAGRGESVDW